MGVHSTLHVRPVAVHVEVEAGGQVRKALAIHDVQVLVDLHEVTRHDELQWCAVSLRPHEQLASVLVVCPGCDLPRQCVPMALLRQNAGSQRHLFLKAPIHLVHASGQRLRLANRGFLGDGGHGAGDSAIALHTSHTHTQGA